MANSISVSITADVVDLQAKRAVMSAELKAATKDLNAFAKEAAATGATDELRAGMLASAEAAEKARAKIATVTQELKELNKVPKPSKHGFEGLIESISQTGVHLRGSLGMFTEFRGALMEIAEVVMVAFAVEKIADWAKEMGEAAEKTKHLAETFGMTVPEVQGLDAIAKATGMDFDSLAKGMGILDKNTLAAADGNGKAAVALKAVGVSASDGKTQMERMLTISDKFKDMDDGPKKVALAMELFGKSGKDLIPILNMGSEGLQAMDKVTQDYAAGAMFATEANKELRDWLDQVNARGMALADATDTTTIAMQGLGNIMTDAFAPILADVTEGTNELIKAFIESYREGGVVAVVMQAVTNTLSAVWEIVKALGEIFYEVFSANIEIVSAFVSDIMDAFGIKTPQAMNAASAAWNIFKDVVVIAKDIILIAIDLIVSAIKALIGDLVTLGKVAYDAMTLNWGAIEGDWAAGMARVQKQVEATTAKIQGHAKEMQQAMSAAMRGESMPGKEGEAPRPKQVRDFDPDLVTPGKKAKGKDDLVQRLQEELTAKKLAWDMEQDAQGTAQQFSLQTEKDFWAQALQLTNLSTKDRLAIEEKYLAASKQLRGQQIAGRIEDYKKEEQEAGKDADAKLAIVKKETAFIKAEYGEQSEQYKAALRNQAAAEKEAADQKLAIERTYIEARQKLAEMALAQDEADDKFLVDMHLKTQAQMYADEKANLDRTWALQKQDFDRRIREAAKDPQEQAKLQAQELIAYQQYQNRKTQIDQQAILQRTQIERNAINQVSQSWGQAFGKLVTLQQGFTASIREMFVGLQQAIGNAIGSIVQQWLEQQITALLLGGAQQQVAAAGQISANAAVAASGAYAATAAIPIVGPELAPEAAAAAYAGAIGWMGALSVPGFDVGAWDLSKDQLAMVHTGEMIIPPGMADGMRNMMTMFAGGGHWQLPASLGTGLRDMIGMPSNDNALSRGAVGSAASEGDVHVHLSVTAMDSSGVRKVLLDNTHHLAEAVRKAKREQRFTNMKF